MRISLKQVPSCVSSRTPFDCNKSLFSEQTDGAYIVYSYGKHFPVAAFVKGIWLFNEDKYSPTTSRHQSKVLQGLPTDNVVKTTRSHIKDVVAALTH